VFDLSITNMSKKGYIMEKNETFVTEPEYHYVLDYLNENISYIEEIYKQVVAKGDQNDSQIRDFEVL